MLDPSIMYLSMNPASSVTSKPAISKGTALVKAVFLPRRK